MAAPQIDYQHGIVLVEFASRTRITLDEVQAELVQRKALSNHPHPVLITLHGISDFSYEAQCYLGSTQYCSITQAMGFYLPSKMSYPVLTEYHLKMLHYYRKPPFPMDIFHDRQTALHWLSGYSNDTAA